MYVAKDAVAKLAGTLPQRVVVPCFVRGARLRVFALRVFALRVRVSVCERGFACACVCLGKDSSRVLASVLPTPGRPRRTGRRGPLDQDASALNL